MVIKKKVKKKSSKKISKKRYPSVSKRTNKPKKNNNKIKIAISNLVLFAILLIISFLLYYVSSNEMLVNLFSLLSIVFGVITGAFLLILLVLLFMKGIKK